MAGRTRLGASSRLRRWEGVLLQFVTEVSQCSEELIKRATRVDRDCNVYTWSWIEFSTGSGLGGPGVDSVHRINGPFAFLISAEGHRQVTVSKPGHHALELGLDKRQRLCTRPPFLLELVLSRCVASTARTPTEHLPYQYGLMTTGTLAARVERNASTQMPLPPAVYASSHQAILVQHTLHGFTVITLLCPLGVVRHRSRGARLGKRILSFEACMHPCALSLRVLVGA